MEQDRVPKVPFYRNLLKQDCNSPLQQPRSVVVNHPRLWIWGLQFESARGYQSLSIPLFSWQYAKYPDCDDLPMSDNAQPRFYGIAVIGLFFIIVGVIMLFAFIASITGAKLPEFLEFRSEAYNIVLIGLVNLGAAFGLLYRTKGVWTFTLIFITVIMIGDIMDLFFTGVTKFVIFFAYLATVMYLLSGEAKIWYNIK